MLKDCPQSKQNVVLTMLRRYNSLDNIFEEQYARG
jgi:hypothetical protein